MSYILVSLLTPCGKKSCKNILFFKKFEEILIKVSERSKRKMALVVKGLEADFNRLLLLQIKNNSTNFRNFAAVVAAL